MEITLLKISEDIEVNPHDLKVKMDFLKQDMKNMM
jgi:hypothetical protein